MQLRQLAQPKHANPHVVAGVGQRERVGGCGERAPGVGANDVEGGERGWGADPHDNAKAVALRGGRVGGVLDDGDAEDAGGLQWGGFECEERDGACSDVRCEGCGGQGEGGVEQA